MTRILLLYLTMVTAAALGAAAFVWLRARRMDARERDARNEGTREVGSPNPDDARAMSPDGPLHPVDVTEGESLFEEIVHYRSTLERPRIAPSEQRHT